MPTVLGAAITCLLAFLVLILALTALEVMRRHGWRPVDRLADFISYGPSRPLGTGASSPNVDDAVDAELVDA